MKSQDERTGEVNVDFTSQIVIAPSWSEAVGVPNPDMVADDARPRRADPDPLQPGAALHGSAPDEADGEATSGLLLDGRYRLIELLGRGGSGAVYRGTDLLLRRQVAVKIFHSSATEPVTAARQRAEMMFLARLNHPNLVSIYDARVVTCSGAGAVNHHAAADSSYLVMEFVDGASLAQRLSGAALTPDECAAVGIAVAKALAAVHNHGLVHRDVKPANILLPVTGGAKLTDFGIARQLNSAHLTTTAEVMGTPLYLSPEQATGGEVGPGTDIYSLGLVLLECVTGTPEFIGTPMQSAIARLLRDPQIPLTLPAPWPDLLRSMTGPVPAERPTPDTVAAVLTEYLGDRERSRTATTVTTAPPTFPDGVAPDDPVIPRRHHHPVPGASVAAAPTPVPRLTRDLTVLTCGAVLAVITAVIILTASADEHPTGTSTTTQGTTTRTTTAPARTGPATPTPVATDRGVVHPAPAVTVITTETATTTETTTTSPSESTTPSTVPSASTTPPTMPSESTTPPRESTTPPSESTVPIESTMPPTVPSESTTPPIESTTPPATPIEFTTASTTPPDTAVR
jgi:serine/threonine protein kinase